MVEIEERSRGAPEGTACKQRDRGSLTSWHEFVHISSPLCQASQTMALRHLQPKQNFSPERSGSGGNTSVGFLSLALWLKALVRDGRSRGVRSESVRARAGEPTYAVGYMPRPASDLPHAQPSSSSSSGGQGSTVMGSLHNMHRAHGIKLGIELDWSALGMHAVCSRNDTHYTRRAAYGATCRVFDGTHPTVICSAFSSCAAPPPANHVPVVHSTRDVTGCTNSEWLI